MENASKALIIAGAILLAILIIGLGVFIYNQASNTVGETGMDQVAIRQFNGQFEPYINKTIDSTAAKALIDTANNVNQTGINRVEILGVTSKSNVKTGHKYTVTPSYSNGVITEIAIKDEDGSTITADEEDIMQFNKQFAEYIVVPTINEIRPGMETAPKVLSGSNTARFYDLIVDVNSPNHYIEVDRPKDIYNHCNYETRAVYGEDKYLSIVIIECVECSAAEVK